MTEFSQEQWLAIKSSGGLLVSAGAGSGKTAVLVEHLIYWIENRLSQKSLNEWEIESFLKKLIVITFTVKASEEMKMRLLERLEEIISKGLDENKVRFWLKIKASLNSIYVGTIDGLFVKIINNNIDLLPVGVS